MILRRLISAALFAAAAIAAAPVLAQPTGTAVKAEFLPRFARYVTWPPSARPGGGEPFTLCLVGGDPFGQAIDRAARAQSIDGRRIVVRRVASAQSAGGCHIAFVAGGDEPTGQALAAFAGRPVLTVTDARNGSHRGIIHFTIAGGRVRFFIDEAQAADRGLSISSRLLALAIGVRQR